jgi:ATP-dependent protease ClpP protease subunit
MRTIRIEGEIDAKAAERFRRELDAAGNDDVIVEINSPGGSFIAGLGMFSALRDHAGETVARVIHAGSAATIPMCACKEVAMAPEGSVFIHEPSALAVKDIQLDIGDLNSCVGRLEGTATIIAGLYAARAGGRLEWWRHQMAEGTTWSAKGAVACGLADGVEGGSRPVGEAVTIRASGKLEIGRYLAAGGQERARAVGVGIGLAINAFVDSLCHEPHVRFKLLRESRNTW